MTDQQQDSPQVVAESGRLIRRFLSEAISSHRLTYLAAMAAMALVALATAATAWVMGEIVDAMTHPANGTVAKVGLVVVGIFFVKGIASYIQVVLMARAGNRIIAEKQSLLYRRMLSQGLSFFNATESSDLLLRVTQSAQKAREVVDLLVTAAVRDILTLAGLIAVMIYQQPVLSVVCLIVGPLALFGVRLLLRRVRVIAAQEMEGLAEIIKVVQETASGVRVVKAFALEGVMADRLDGAVRQVEKRANKIVRLESATTPLMDTLTGLAIAGIVVLSAASLFGRAAGTAGQLMSFVTAFLMAYEPAKRLSKMRVTLEAGMVGVKMMYDLLDAPLTLTEAANPVDLPAGPGEVVLRNVRFGYGDKPVLDGLDLTFAAGKMTALVGPSGSGKSTILNLIMRMHDPDQGQVVIDGVDLRQASFASLRARIAYVGQDTFLFSDSILENLRFGRSNASDQDVIAAARDAHAHEFIESLPQGYLTQIGENGAFLSGGQRQRIAIARAILRQAPILLLDEATSGLDSHSEALVKDALARVTKGKTTIVIAHRLSTVMEADRICYLEAGQLREAGTVQEMLDRDGPFRALFEAQFGPRAR